MGCKTGEFHLELDYYGALNLHKALLEAKFNANPDNELVSGSPLVADIHVQVREFLIKSDESGQWKEWFLLKNRSDYRARAIMRMKKCKRWNKVSFEEKKKIAGDFLAPFFYGETELNEIMAEMTETLEKEFGESAVRNTEGESKNKKIEYAERISGGRTDAIKWF